MTFKTSESMTIERLVDAANGLAVPGQRKILGIVGAPGAGKSTLAEQISSTLGATLAAFVPMDGYHLSNSVLEKLGRHSRKGAIDTFDDAGYAALLERLHLQTADSNEVVYASEFRRDIEEPIGSALPITGATPLVITEGNYLLQPTGAWPRARACMDEVWYLDIDDKLRHKRLIKRHEAYGKSPMDARLWALGSDEENARLIAGVAHSADRILRLS